jgi:hypothetical protein
MRQVLPELAGRIVDDGSMARVDGARREREQPFERAEIVHQRPGLIVDHDRARPGDQVTGEQRALGWIPEAQALARVARRCQRAKPAKGDLTVPYRALDAG